MKLKQSAGWMIAITLWASIPSHELTAQQERKPVRARMSEQAKEAIDFFVGDELVTRYHIKGYARPIFWPVNAPGGVPLTRNRSEEHTSELQSRGLIAYAVFC